MLSVHKLALRSHNCGAATCHRVDFLLFNEFQSSDERTLNDDEVTHTLKKKKNRDRRDSSFKSFTHIKDFTCVNRERRNIYISLCVQQRERSHQRNRVKSLEAFFFQETTKRERAPPLRRKKPVESRPPWRAVVSTSAAPFVCVHFHRIWNTQKIF